MQGYGVDLMNESSYHTNLITSIRSLEPTQKARWRLCICNPDMHICSSDMVCICNSDVVMAHLCNPDVVVRIYL